MENLKITSIKLTVSAHDGQEGYNLVSQLPTIAEDIPAAIFHPLALKALTEQLTENLIRTYDLMFGEVNDA